MGQVWPCHQFQTERELVNRWDRSGHVISVRLRENWSTDGAGLAIVISVTLRERLVNRTLQVWPCHQCQTVERTGQQMGQVWPCHQCHSKRELVNRLCRSGHVISVRLREKLVNRWGRSGHVISVRLRENWSTDGAGLAMSSVSL